MGVLHLSPVILLGVVAVWLLWPVLVEPVQRRIRAFRRPRSEPADVLAEGLFFRWAQEGTLRHRLPEPLRRS